MLNEQSTQANGTEERPAAIKSSYKRKCGECGMSFIAQRSHAQFCCPAHNRTYQNRLQVEGRAIVALAKAWRLGRNAKGNSPEAMKTKEVATRALAELCAVLDSFNMDDRDAGRINSLDYVRQLMGSGSRYMDRQRSR